MVAIGVPEWRQSLTGLPLTSSYSDVDKATNFKAHTTTTSPITKATILWAKVENPKAS